MKPLPPYGRQYVAAPPSAGLCVAIGVAAWRFAEQKPFPVLVLPPERDPCEFRWPTHSGGAAIFERGEVNDDRLIALATELLIAGCPFVVAIREALMGSDPRVFFDKEIDSAAT